MNLKDLKDKNWFPYTVATCSAVLFYFLLNNIYLLGNFFAFIWHIICPLVAGTIIAYMMDPIARFFENQVFPQIKQITLGRKAAVALTGIIIYGGLFILFSLLVPSLLRSITDLIGNIDGYEKIIVKFMQSHGLANQQMSHNISTLVAKIKELAPNLTKDVLASTTQMSGTMANIGMGCILAIYFLLYKKRIVPWVKGVFQKLIHPDSYGKFSDFCSRCNTILLKYLSCTLIDGIIIGSANAVYMLLLHIPFVALISVMVGITNLLPTFGPIIGGAIGFVILALSSPGHAILFLIFTLIIQTIDGYIIKPKLFGNSLGVSSLWILIAIICGGKVFGVVGVLLAIPFAAIIQYLLEEILFPKAQEIKKTM